MAHRIRKVKALNMKTNGILIGAETLQWGQASAGASGTKAEV